MWGLEQKAQDNGLFSPALKLRSFRQNEKTHETGTSRASFNQIITLKISYVAKLSESKVWMNR